MPRRRRCGDEPEMGHAGEADHGRLHGVPFNATACALKRASTRWSQMSFDRSVFAPVSHRVLKCAYSSAQVGSSCTNVMISSGGRPLGNTRLRVVNSDGPHLHSDAMCAEPRSARMSHVKW